MTKSNTEIRVEKILDNYKKWIISKDRQGLLNTELPFWDRKERQETIDQILTLVPEEGEVIFTAKLEDGINLSKVIEQVLCPKRIGQKIQIKVIEDKE